jgi:uncharacterized protein (DUF427 family)
MAIRFRSALTQHLNELRYEPTDKRIRALLDDHTVIDSTRAMLVWEPKRVVPTYAVPADDVDGEIVALEADGDGPLPAGVPLGDLPVYDPSIPFSAHTADGEPVAIRAPGTSRQAAAFRPEDDALDGYVIVDFAGFDTWLEEDERNVSHPKDPFHRIDILHSSRDVRIELDGVLLAHSTNAHFLFEPPLPVRYYLPAEDVRTDLLTKSSTTTYCAYKGAASHWSLASVTDVAWTYHEPLRDAEELRGRIAFYGEHVDVFVDGVALERPITPWSRR